MQSQQTIKSISGVCKSCYTTEAIKATLLALQCFIKCKRNNNKANSKIFFLNVKIKMFSKVYIVRRQKIVDWLLCSLWDIFAYSWLKLKPMHNLLDALFETRWNWFYVRLLRSIFRRSTMFDCLSFRFPNVRLCSISKILGWVRLSSITEPNRSQSKDWSSIGFDYRTFDWLRREYIIWTCERTFNRSNPTKGSV